MDTNKYIKYILNKGSIANREIKNNIYYSENELLRLLLIDYINDTLNNYDSRNCPHYMDDNIPIIPENKFFSIISEDAEFNLLSEDGTSIMVTENSMITNTFDVISTEDNVNYFESEGDIEKYTYDRAIIENYLINLTKDISC